VEIFVTRHGITPLNIAKKVNGEVDEPLAPEGVAQARAAARLLPEYKIYLLLTIKKSKKYCPVTQFKFKSASC